MNNGHWLYVDLTLEHFSRLRDAKQVSLVSDGWGHEDAPDYAMEATNLIPAGSCMAWKLKGSSLVQPCQVMLERP